MTWVWSSVIGTNSKKCRPTKIGNIPPVQTSLRSGTNSTTVAANANCLGDPSIAFTRKFNLAPKRGVPLASSMTLYHCGYLSTSIMICQRMQAGAAIVDLASTRTIEIFEYLAIDDARMIAANITRRMQRPHELPMDASHESCSSEQPSWQPRNWAPMRATGKFSGAALAHVPTPFCHGLGATVVTNCFANALHAGCIDLPKKLSTKARKNDADIIIEAANFAST